MWNFKGKLKSASFWVALIGATKLATDALGFTVISDAQVNTIANCIAAIVTCLGVAYDHGATS